MNNPKIELVKTIDMADGSVINVFQPKEKPSKEELSSFIEFIVDLKYRDIKMSMARGNNRCEV